MKETKPFIYSEETRTKARNLFLRGLAPKEIASKLDIPVSRIYDWSEKCEWSKAKKRIAIAKFEKSSDDIAEIIANTRVTTFTRQINTFSAIEKSVLSLLCKTDSRGNIRMDDSGSPIINDNLSPKEIQQLSAAAKNCSSVVSSLFRLDDSIKANQVKPTINFNINPQQAFSVSMEPKDPALDVPFVEAGQSIYDAEDDA